MSVVRFTKMQGLGNDFVVIDAMRTPFTLSPAAIRRIADRRFGVGCDQVLVVEPPRGADADFRYRIFNADGGEVEQCGNGARCFVVFVRDRGLTARREIRVETAGGLIVPRLEDDGEVTVDMGAPRFDWREVPLAEEFHDTRAIELQIGPIDEPILHSPSALSMGNPHAIFWVDDVEAYALDRFGPLLENHPMFPERANISLAAVRSREHLVVRTWERGAGLTKACGSAACAATVAAARTRRTGRKVTVTLPGGDLLIDWRESDNHVLMTGPVEYEFEGRFDPALFVAVGAA